ncbi:sigma-70 region 4 domain-containing protein [Methanimicrococcus blatticola]|uniref:Uncharacterized protein n=1 Tax=Methanimicrococcus blatticola TaxID=91560 RepID=A0A484F613_9EURY|nr:sigma-70 region 4 domain-containing protein [Methanimicrococcus blatticola]MBZ3936057.1 hypothetical protein [Methanimicrococcus blatticola]MCC2509331.1 sigma-70 region 4 domain-containing protein [Methanimicrococcus blatticola]TDQ68217.1 hypothetical protein C7391_1155 [Methanimicrococcus blatticola]
MSYFSHLTQEQKRLYFSDFDAYFQNHQDLSPAETLYNYYSYECGYTPKEISQKTGRAYTTIQNTLQNAKKKQSSVELDSEESDDCEILPASDIELQKLAEDQKIVRPFNRSDLASSIVGKLLDAGINEENASNFVREMTLGDLIKMVETNEIFIPLKYIEKNKD